MKEENKFFKSFRDRDYQIVAGIGHRDPLPNEIGRYKDMIEDKIKSFIQPNQKYLIVTPIADGADRLFVEVAKEMNIEYAVLLPMPKELYMIDFDSHSLVEFERLLDGAIDVESLGLYEENTIESISNYSKERDLQYREVGRVLAKESDEFIALWDGEINYLMGGTADIIEYRQKIVQKPLSVIQCKRVLAKS